MRNSLAEATLAEHQDPDHVDAKLTELARSQSVLDVEIGEWLLAAERIKVFEKFGYASVFEYAERKFGWDGRHVFERLRVARKLEKLPATRDQLLDGRIVWSVAREITRVAETPDVEAEWLLEVRGRTVREVERMVSNRGANSRPRDPKDPRLQRHRVCLDLSSEEYARYQDSIQRERGRTGDPKMTEEQAVLSAMTHGEEEPGLAANQLAFVRKIDGEETYVQTRAGAMLVTAATAERIECDATILPATENGEIVKKASQTIPPAIRRQVIAEAGGRCEVPGCTKCYLEVHHRTFRSDGGTHELRFLIAICWYHHTRIHDGYLQLDGDRVTGWRFRHADGSPYGTPGTSQMQQGVADAYHGLRRLGYKDPTARQAATDASAELASEGKKATGEAVFERALHRGGKPGKGNTITKAPSAHVGRSEAELDAISGLRNLGYREAEARASVDGAIAGLGSSGLTAEAILTAALRARGANLVAREGGGHCGASVVIESESTYGSAHVGTKEPSVEWLSELYDRALAELEEFTNARGRHVRVGS